MLRILQQLILTALFAAFASQATAMFISPDPMNPTHPGVGTNRYAYSHGDPINMSDPSGLATVYKDTDGDGLNEYYGEINPGDLGWNDDFSNSGVLPSEWVDINRAINSGGKLHVFWRGRSCNILSSQRRKLVLTHIWTKAIIRQP